MDGFAIHRLVEVSEVLQETRGGDGELVHAEGRRVRDNVVAVEAAGMELGVRSGAVGRPRLIRVGDIEAGGGEAAVRNELCEKADADSRHGDTIARAASRQVGGEMNVSTELVVVRGQDAAEELVDIDDIERLHVVAVHDVVVGIQVILLQAEDADLTEVAIERSCREQIISNRLKIAYAIASGCTAVDSELAALKVAKRVGASIVGLGENGDGLLAEDGGGQGVEDGAWKVVEFTSLLNKSRRVVVDRILQGSSGERITEDNLTGKEFIR